MPSLILPFAGDILAERLCDVTEISDIAGKTAMPPDSFAEDLLFKSWNSHALEGAIEVIFQMRPVGTG